MYYIGLGVHKKTISFCVKDTSGRIQQQGTIPATHGTGQLDETTSSTVDGSDGGDNLHRLDI